MRKSSPTRPWGLLGRLPLPVTALAFGACYAADRWLGSAMLIAIAGAVGAALVTVAYSLDPEDDPLVR